MYIILKDFQSLIGAVFALVTLVIGAHLKFSYDRRVAQMLREERRAALHGSLYIETLLLCQLIGQLGEALLEYLQSDAVEISADFLAMHNLPQPTVYGAIVKDVGEMDVYVAAQFVSFYAHYGRMLGDTALLTRKLPNRDARHVLRIVQESIAIAEQALAMVDQSLDRESPELPSMKAIIDFLDSGTASAAPTEVAIAAVAPVIPPPIAS